MSSAGSAETTAEVIAEFEAAGYVSQFMPDRQGHLRCLACDRRTHPDEVPARALRRVEGESDPADMAAVVGLECPHCDARGTVVLKYGPDASVEEAEVLSLLERDHRPTR